MKKMMKAVAFLAILLTTQVAAQSDMYIGLDTTSGNTTFLINKKGSDAIDVDDNTAFKIKIGGLTTSEGYRWQIYFLQETYGTPFFDGSSDKLNEIGLDIINDFEMTSKFFPFVQTGFGMGLMDIDGYSESSISEYSFKVGAGIMYKVSPRFEIIGGVDYKYRKWQDIELLGKIVSTTENNTKFYIGGNFYFYIEDI